MKLREIGETVIMSRIWNDEKLRHILECKLFVKKVLLEKIVEIRMKPKFYRS